MGRSALGIEPDLTPSVKRLGPRIGSFPILANLLTNGSDSYERHTGYITFLRVKFDCCSLL